MVGAVVTPLLVMVLSGHIPVAVTQSNIMLGTGDRRPERGHELEVWTGAGGDPVGSHSHTIGSTIWTVGVRYGWVLSDAHGPGFLCGRFEYAVDAIPVFVVFQPVTKAYGFGFDPLVMKWKLRDTSTGCAIL